MSRILCSNVRIWVSLKKHVAPTYRYRACARQRLLVRRRRIYDLQKIIHEQLHETNRVRLEVEVWLFLTYFPPHKEKNKVSNPAAPTRISVLITTRTHPTPSQHTVDTYRHIWPWLSRGHIFFPAEKQTTRCWRKDVRQNLMTFISFNPV